MTAKKKFNFKAPLEVFAKSIVQPMMYLSVAGQSCSSWASF